MHTGRAVHQEANISSQLGGQPARAHLASMRHAVAKRLAGRGQSALLPDIKVEKSLQKTSERGVLVHAAASSGPSGSNVGA